MLYLFVDSLIFYNAPPRLFLLHSHKWFGLRIQIMLPMHTLKFSLHIVLQNPKVLSAETKAHLKPAQCNPDPQNPFVISSYRTILENVCYFISIVQWYMLNTIYRWYNYFSTFLTITWWDAVIVFHRMTINIIKSVIFCKKNILYYCNFVSKAAGNMVEIWGLYCTVWDTFVFDGCAQGTTALPVCDSC